MIKDRKVFSFLFGNYLVLLYNRFTGGALNEETYI